MMQCSYWQACDWHEAFSDMSCKHATILPQKGRQPHTPGTSGKFPPQVPSFGLCESWSYANPQCIWRERREQLLGHPLGGLAW